MRKQDPSFEKLFAELEATVQKLEAGNLTLDESLTLYERGMQLAKQCGEQLDRAELRVQELAPVLGEALEASEELAAADDEEEGD